MAVDRPRTRIEFSQVSGVGETKLEQFANVFLAEIGKK